MRAVTCQGCKDAFSDKHRKTLKGAAVSPECGADLFLTKQHSYGSFAADWVFHVGYNRYPVQQSTRGLQHIFKHTQLKQWDTTTAHIQTHTVKTVGHNYSTFFKHTQLKQWDTTVCRGFAEGEAKQAIPWSPKLERGP